jgi:hypothetical protein
MTVATDEVRAVVRLRTLGPSGLNPPQTEVVDRLRTLAEDGPIVELDVGVWDGPVGITQTEHRDSEGTRETVAEFERWADEQGCTLRPAFERHAVESTNDGEGRIVTPLITLAVYDEGRLRAVYPHIGGEDVRTIHDGVEALESMVGKDAERSNAESPAAPLP